MAKYARRRALVQSGVTTQIIFGVIATAIIAACGIFLGVEVQANKLKVSERAIGGLATQLDSHGRAG